MRNPTFLLALLATAALTVGCGDDKPKGTPDDGGSVENGSVESGTVNVDGGIQLSDDAKAALAKRMASMGDRMTNRIPGMPQIDGAGGNPKVDIEALRRAMNVTQEPITDEEMKKFFAVSREARANPEAYQAILKKHSMSALRLGMIGAMFARHQLAADKLSAEETALMERWQDEWKSLTNKK